MTFINFSVVAILQDALQMELILSYEAIILLSLTISKDIILKPERKVPLPAQARMLH